MDTLTLNRRITDLRGQGSPEAIAEATALEAEAEDLELETAEGARAAELQRSKEVRDAVNEAGLQGHDGLRVGTGKDGAITMDDVDRVKARESDNGAAADNGRGGSPFASEAAEKLAKEKGLDADAIEATGSTGITVGDVKKAAG